MQRGNQEERLKKGQDEREGKVRDAILHMDSPSP